MADSRVKPDTLCWTCNAPITGSCCWSRSRGCTPVPGWTAEETVIFYQADPIRSYRVIDCPLYQERKQLPLIEFVMEQKRARRA